MDIALDGSTPNPTHITQDATGVITSDAFAPPGMSLVVVLIGVGRNVNAPDAIQIPFDVSDSVGNDYSEDAHRPFGTALTVSIFSFFYYDAPGTITVTLTVPPGQNLDFQVCPLVLTGCSPDQVLGGVNTVSSVSTNVEGSILTTETASWVLVATAVNTPDTLVADGLTTTIDDFSATDSELICGMASSATGTPGLTTLGWTDTSGARFVWAAREIQSITYYHPILHDPPQTLYAPNWFPGADSTVTASPGGIPFDQPFVSDTLLPVLPGVNTSANATSSGVGGSGAGAWVNPGNADGPPDGSRATWTAP